MELKDQSGTVEALSLLSGLVWNLRYITPGLYDKELLGNVLRQVLERMWRDQ